MTIQSGRGYNRAILGYKRFCSTQVNDKYNQKTMKTTLLALAAAMPLMAGTYTEPVNPYSLELGVGYNFAARNLIRFNDGSGPKVDTVGVDLTCVYAVSEHSSFNLRFGFASGSDSHGFVNEFDSKFRVNSFILMPGYRYTHRLNDWVDGFIGANIGVINESIKLRINDDTDRIRMHGSEYGFAYSGEAGLRFELTRRFDLFVAYQFLGSTAQPELNNIRATRTRAQLYHSVRAGLSYDF